VTSADDQPAKPKSLGKYYTLEDVSMRIAREANFIEFCRHATDEAAHVAELIEKQKDHEATHMP
jgi:hypothetical protein